MLIELCRRFTRSSTDFQADGSDGCGAKFGPDQHCLLVRLRSYRVGLSGCGISIQSYRRVDVYGELLAAHATESKVVNDTALIDRNQGGTIASTFCIRHDLLQARFRVDSLENNVVEEASATLSKHD